MESIETIKTRLKELLSQGLDLTFNAAKAAIATGTDAYNNLILLESRYQETMRQLLQGIVSNEVSAIEVNKIRLDLLHFIDSLQANHLTQQGGMGKDGKPDVFNGEVLYRIPNQMQLEQETKCIVRLAFDRDIITEGLEIQEDDVLKDLRISDVMGVELIDPKGSAFQIRTLHDTVQFVDQDLFTEWIFFVKPLAGGTQELILKISIIEIKNGIERKRNIVLEEKVEILTTAPTRQSEAFTNTGVAIKTPYTAPTYPETLPPEPAAEIKHIQPSPSAPPMPAPTPSITPGNAAPKKAKGSFMKIASRLSALLILVVGSWAIWQHMDDGGGGTVHPIDEPSHGYINENPSRSEMEDFLKKNPESKMAPVIIAKLDSMEMKTWDDARNSGDSLRIKEYLNIYPEGKFKKDAFEQLKKVDTRFKLEVEKIQKLEGN